VRLKSACFACQAAEASAGPEGATTSPHQLLVTKSSDGTNAKSLSVGARFCSSIDVFSDSFLIQLLTLCPVGKVIEWKLDTTAVVRGMVYRYSARLPSITPGA
jgi:hypothetical protein